MNRAVSLILLLIGIALLVYGIVQLQDSSASVAIGDLELSAADEGSQTQSYIMIGLGAVGVIIGGLMMRGKS